MAKRFFFLCLLLFLQCTVFSHARDRIKLVAPNFEPYTFEENGEIQGIGVDFVEKLMKEIGTPFTLTLIPNYGRALQEIKIGRADGFFLASENEERNAVAVFSDPVIMNRWCWILPAESKLNPKAASFKRSARIGTHLHTNTHRWLQKNGFRDTITPDNVEALVKMFERDRVDAVFLAEYVFVHAARKRGFSSERYRLVVEVAQPFGIYISKEYLSRNTGFMENLNKAIGKNRK